MLDPPGPGGLCPVCLLKTGLQASADTGTSETATAGPDTAGTETVSPGAADVPGVIGPYHLLQAPGEGGMGLVCLEMHRIIRQEANRQ
jgi:hypothetical protein